jgi:hypothetical protein
MDLPIHDEILWHACVKARQALGSNAAMDPLLAFPYLVRGSWMNDMNQVSPLLDKANPKDLGEQQITLFHGLWKLELAELFEAPTRLKAMAHSGDLLNARAQFLGAPQQINGFGKYDARDHLDVEANEPDSEYDAAWSTSARFGRAHTTQIVVHNHIPSRLNLSSLVDQRFTPERLSILGRALHSTADFFAHSNYVELLLWSLAWRGRLDPDLVKAFNYDSGSNDLSGPLFRCPLPPEGPRDSGLLRNAVLWYGPSPEETPLVSAVFDQSDTAFSLLHMYASRLVRTDGQDQTDAALDIAMAVFDIQGAALIKGAYGILSTVRDVFAAIGKAARGLLADQLDRLASTQTDAQIKDFMTLTANLVRRYSQQEADEWSRAGRLDYLARTLQADMARELRNQQASKMLLPHHSLIAKDHIDGDAGGHFRFKLACLLATEATSNLLQWHFARPLPKLEDYDNLANSVMIHPWRLLERAGFREGDIASLVHSADGMARWQDQSLSGLNIMEGIP